MVRVVLQRVLEASVTVDDREVSHIAHGLALFLGISRMDDAATVDRMADKVSTLRIFEDSAGKMNISVGETNGSILVVSQFTLFGDVTRGRRPSFTDAADPASARLLYERFAERLKGWGHHVACGDFGAHMVVALVNDGPVTLILDSGAI